MGAAESRVMTDPPQTELRLEQGDLIAGKYRVEDEIGSGGMGVVVSARHVTMGNRLAIKVLKLHDEKDPTGAIARFVREARAAARIQSDHVVRVIDVAALPDGTPYMVMEYLEGEDLRAVLERRGQLPTEEAVGYVLQACEGLAEAHASGVVHRDLKPSNLFLAKKSNGTSVIKILDFGISKILPRGGEAGITTTGALMGSPLYMAPEQMRSTKEVDARADVWSLGLILYELLSGRCPFEGDSIPEVCLSVMGADPVPITRFRPDVAGDLQAILVKCLAKDRKDRYEGMGTLARALERFASASSRVHAERASAAARSGREEVVVVAAEEAPRSPFSPTLLSKNNSGGIVVRRPEPESPPSWSAERARPRRSKIAWIALGTATCASAVLLGALLARGPAAGRGNKAAFPPSLSSAPPSSAALAPVTTSDVPSVSFDSLPTAPSDTAPTSAAFVPARTKPAPSSTPPPSPPAATPARARPSTPRSAPAPAASAEKDGWKWGDRN
jgi:eukaryotic-like serine/threonine-protein kinase